jgi:hypothetical protein
MAMSADQQLDEYGLRRHPVQRSNSFRKRHFRKRASIHTFPMKSHQLIRLDYIHTLERNIGI